MAPTLTGKVRLSQRGWYTVSAMVVMVVLAALFGVEELYALAAGAGAALLAASWLVYQDEGQFLDTARADPVRGSPGTTVLAHFSITNAGDRRSTPMLGAVAVHRHDSSGALPARDIAPPLPFHIPALRPKSHADIVMEIGEIERGVWKVGALRATMTDPLGLMGKEWSGNSYAFLVVHPRVQPLDPLPKVATATNDGAVAQSPQTQRSEELQGVREYHEGDDARRVHWRATARWDRLMVRNDERGREPVVCIGLDLRARRRAAESFERSLEVAASITCAYLAEPGHVVQLGTTSGQRFGPGRGISVKNSVLDGLAVASEHSYPSVGPLFDRRADLVILVSSTESAAGELMVGERLAGSPQVLIVVTDEGPADGEPTVTLRPCALSRLPVRMVKAGADLRRPWAEAVASLSPAPSRPWLPLANRRRPVA